MAMLSPVRGFLPWRGRPRPCREGSKAGDCDGSAAGKNIGDGREHGVHGGVGVRLRHDVRAATRAVSSALFMQDSLLESVRLSVSRYRKWS